VISRLDDLAGGRFQRILPDESKQPTTQVKRVLLCTGKIYYELAQYREEHKREDTAILRLEQLYPLDANLVLDALRVYGKGTPIFWVQEEPENMGAWRYLVSRFLGPQGLPFDGIYRPASASPATGSAKAHQLEQAQIIEAAFNKT
jgi:2-oxoglutarate dehydrogenase E1 component